MLETSYPTISRYVPECHSVRGTVGEAPMLPLLLHKRVQVTADPL